jgi:hypothetical protein
MKVHATYSGTTRQRGISLFVAMIMLAGVTMMSLAAARMTLLEITMAGNDQDRIDSFERAAVIDFNSGVGHIDCTGNVALGADCDEQTITLPSGDFHPSKNYGWSKRVGAAKLLCPPAYLEISCTDAKAAYFEFRSRYDDRAAGGAMVEVTQGLLSILPEQD